MAKTNKNTGILIIGILLFTAFIFLITYHKKGPGEKLSGTFSNQPVPEISVKTFQTNNHWGYEIYLDTTLFIYQEFLPGVPGEQLFTTEQQALQCGNLVREKLMNSTTPSITKRELDSLGIKYVLN
jgi:hypothetical protein